MTANIEQIQSYWNGQEGILREFPPGKGILDKRLLKLLDVCCIKPCCEVGCGSGRLASLFDPRRYIGVDINPQAIENARRQLPIHDLRVIDYESDYPPALSYLFHTVMLHVPDERLDGVIGRCGGNSIAIAETMDRSFRDGKFTFQRNPEEYEAAFARNGYQIALDRQYEIEGGVGFWNFQLYSKCVDIETLYSPSYYAKREEKDELRVDVILHRRPHRNEKWIVDQRAPIREEGQDLPAHRTGETGRDHDDRPLCVLWDMLNDGRDRVLQIRIVKILPRRWDRRDSLIPRIVWRLYSDEDQLRVIDDL